MHQMQQRQSTTGETDVASTIPVVFSGCWDEASQHIMSVFRTGYDIRMEHHSVGRLTDARPIIVGMTLDEHTPFDVLQ